MWSLEVRNITENALSILIVIFSYNSNKPRTQTESCVLSSLGGVDVHWNS